MDKNIVDNELERIRPGIDDFINNRIRHKNFARIIFWLNAMASKGEEYVYSSELSNFFRFSRTRAYQVLCEMDTIGLLRKVVKGNIVEFWFVKNDGHLKIKEYLEKARKVLDIQ